jgi:cell division protein FtsI/penicillin-binding protein 2
MEIVSPQALRDYASRFGFGEPVPADFAVEAGQARIGDEVDWELAETASGYNWNSQMSAVQAAAMGASVANDGVSMQPYLAEHILADNGQTLWKADPRPWRTVVTPASAAALRVLMRETVRNGTAASAFKDFSAGGPAIEVGGKTGTLASIAPKGRCDWFVGYAIGKQQKLGFAVFQIHTRPGEPKSSWIARQLLDSYFRHPQSGGNPDITFKNADFVEIEE